MASLTQNEATEAIYQRWVDNAPAGFDSYTFDGENFKPTQGQDWARLSVRHQASAQETLGESGNRQFKRQGLIIIQVFTPVSAGRRSSDLLVQSARAVFEGVSFSGVVCRAGSPGGEGADGPWYMQNLDIPFSYWELK